MYIHKKLSSESIMNTVWAETALLPTGWASGVQVDIDASGLIIDVKQDVPAVGEQTSFLLPSPANAHSHAFQRAMSGLTEQRGPNPKDSFWTWRQLMFRFLNRLKPQHIQAITAFVQMEMLEAGYATNAEFRAGNVAIMNMWGSRAATLVEAEGVDPSVKDGFAIAGPMTVGGGSMPATTLWWDGWTVAKNTSDAEAEATFIAMAHAIRPEILNDTTSTQAVWLIDGYQPTPAAIGVFAAANAGSTPYPMVPYQGLLHSALGAELGDFMQGKESAEQALADVEAAYTAAAKEKGFL